MNTIDINERIRQIIHEFLISEWVILPHTDLSEQILKYNSTEKVLKINDAEVLLWFAPGVEDTYFFFQEYSAESQIVGSEDTTTEYMGVLVVYQGTEYIFSTSWHGCEEIILGDICATDNSIAKSIAQKIKDHT